MDTFVAMLRSASSSPTLTPPEQARLALNALDLLAHLLLGEIVGRVSGGGVVLVVVPVCSEGVSAGCNNV